MRTFLFLIFICLSIKSIACTQCASRPDVVGGCGCCSILNSNCVTFETIDGLAASWHACVPDYLENNFTLDLCKPEIQTSTNHTRMCRTKYGVFRLFPQCATKQQCTMKTFRKDYKNACRAEFAVKGSCDESLTRFSYDPERRQCVPFIYSGCGGSENNFRLMEICQRNCRT